MKNNPYFIPVLITDILIIGGVAFYIIRDQLAQRKARKEERSNGDLNHHETP